MKQVCDLSLGFWDCSANCIVTSFHKLQDSRNRERSKFYLHDAEKKVGEQIVPVFITIDPERDTVEQIREYLRGNFDFSTTHFGLYSLCVDSLMM